MKLESLKSSKFAAFKGNEIVNAMSIKGGECTNTSAGGGQISDAVNPDWTKAEIHGTEARNEADTKLNTTCTIVNGTVDTIAQVSNVGLVDAGVIVNP